MPFGYAPGLLASFALALAITYSNGAYSEPAVFAVFVGLLILLWRFGSAVFGEPGPSRDSAQGVAGLAWVGLLAMWWLASNDEGLVMYAQKPWATGRACQWAMLLLTLTYVPWLGQRREPRHLRTLRFVLFGACVVAAGLDTLHASPDPAIDVWTVQMKGAEAFGAGKNPFTSVMVGNTDPTAAGPGIPYVYPPMQVYLSFIGYKLGGDVRYTMLFAIVVGGFAMRGLTRAGSHRLPSIVEDAPALFVWMSPKLFFIVEQAWTDPLLVTGIALALWAHVARRRWLAVVAFGFVLATKQTMILLVPGLVFMLGYRPREWLTMCGIAAASMVPYAIASPRALKFSLVEFQNLLPPRPDGLTIRSWLEKAHDYTMSPTWAFVGAVVVLAIALVRLRGRVSLFAATLALLYAVFFAFNKWAFANYYFLVSGLAAISAAASFHSKACTSAPAVASEKATDGPRTLP